MPSKSNTGDILLLFNPPLHNRTKKHGIVVCPHEQWTLYINTKKTLAFRGPKIKHQDYKFLEGQDRYISCTNIYKYSYKVGAINEVVGNFGPLKSNDLSNLISYITAGNTMLPYQSVKIIANLNEIIHT